MVTAYEAVICGAVKEFSDPSSLAYATMKHVHLTEVLLIIKTNKTEVILFICKIYWL